MKFSEFIEELGSDQTRRGYIAAMVGLMNSIYGRENKKYIGEIERELYLEWIEQYLKTEGRNYLADLTKYKEWVEGRMAPRTIRSYLYNCKTVLELCAGYDFSVERKRRLKGLLRGTRKPITKDIPLSHPMIRKIVSHANIPIKAAVLIMATSGIRIGELLKLKMKDFDLEKRMIVIPAHVAKTKEMRTTFYTSEAAEALNMWISYRLTYMKQIEKQCVQIKPGYKLNDERVFPMSNTSLREGVNNAVRNAGLKAIDKNTNRNLIHPHSFRGWFSTTLKSSMSNDDVEVLLGHELPYGGAYWNKSDEDLMKDYRKAEQALFIGSDEVVRETLENVGTDMAQLRSENLALRDEMQKMRKMIMALSINGRIVIDVKDQEMK